MSLAMSFVSGVKAFYDCDTKKKCSDYQRDCVKGEKNMGKNKPSTNGIADGVNKKVKDKIPEVGDKITVDGIEGTVTAVREVTPERNGESNVDTTGETTNGDGETTNGDGENNDVAKNYLDNSLNNEQPKVTKFKKPEVNNDALESRINELESLSDDDRGKISSWAAGELKNVKKSGNGTVNLLANGKLLLDGNTDGRIKEHKRVMKEINRLEGSIIFDSEFEGQTLTVGSGANEKTTFIAPASKEKIQKDKENLLNLTKQLAYIENGGIVVDKNGSENDEWRKLKSEMKQ
tara:strand:- start:535 stop:1407 length:873 start_codon:yes stop_codon:yes gene_type:complete